MYVFKSNRYTHCQFDNDPKLPTDARINHSFLKAKGSMENSFSLGKENV
jgi:hypothetical protein